MNNLLGFPYKPSSAMCRLSRLSQPLNSSNLVFSLLFHFTFGNTCLNRHRPRKLEVESSVMKPYTERRWNTFQGSTKT